MKRRGDLTRIQRYIERQDSPTVAQVLGRFKLPPGDADGVRELLDATNRARDRHTAPTIQGRAPTSTAAGERVGSKKRNTEAGLPGLPGLPGQIDTPSPKIEGGEGGRARVALWKPWKKTADIEQRGGSE